MPRISSMTERAMTAIADASLDASKPAEKARKKSPHGPHHVPGAGLDPIFKAALYASGLLVLMPLVESRQDAP